VECQDQALASRLNTKHAAANAVIDVADEGITWNLIDEAQG